MKLKQLQNLKVIDQDITNEDYGTYWEKRTVEQLLNYGLIILDKPNGPTSHETVAWVKKYLVFQRQDIVAHLILLFLDFYQ